MNRYWITRTVGALVLGATTGAVLAACSPQPAATTTAAADSAAAAAAAATAAKAGPAARPFAPGAKAPASASPLIVTSTTFAMSGALPKGAEFSGCGGGNVSPQLSWSNVPPTTKSFVVTLFDPDAPTTTGFWHWVVFNIPASVQSLPAGAGSKPSPVAKSLSGYTDFGFSHYGGPCPPGGDPPHHYLFSVFALDVPALEGVSAKSTAASVMFTIRGHVLAAGAIEGTFGR
jgi:Raf kinase inhibitor-like YbhB/YbcL family protein